MAAAAPSLRDRLAALTPRERGFLIAGALAVLAFALYLMWPSSAVDEAELATAPPPPVQPLVTPPPAPPISPPIVAAPPPVDPNAEAGLILRGVMGGGLSGGAAIVSGADGAQRVVRVGRELAPGVTLRQVGVHYAIASTAGGEIRFELNKPGSTPVATTSIPPPAPQVGAPPAQRETTEFRLGLQPMRSNGRVGGYSIRSGAVPARLQQAGLRPGDVILRVNGSELNEERLMELSWELSNADRTEFEFVRNGQRMKAALKGK